ncbi:hypothetical protein BJF93_07060 [Xaviernesmea oryzae]|uniref:Uncharacterized protein n=1 Tax=Xaviernesmea oryzae TaxID=464029 RepID=A0A1Q9ASC7_9HYPH|nr:hypothetical protein [Xaviernesmea oryzae]OLP58352.1 hypothetical protein BJF93_07060 [Xaviernesmea oryzae]SEL40813.1 hypothetical protein SAMN04487976_1082 [Xaviernesmea oryzae]
MALRGDVGGLTEAFLLELIGEQKERTGALEENTPLNRYSIEASEIMQECCARMIDGAATVDDLLGEMLRRQKVAAERHGVWGQL